MEDEATKIARGIFAAFNRHEPTEDELNKCIEEASEALPVMVLISALLGQYPGMRDKRYAIAVLVMLASTLAVDEADKLFGDLEAYKQIVTDLATAAHDPAIGSYRIFQKQKAEVDASTPPETPIDKDLS